ncbi:MAG: MFS transporter, partial [Alphaproteobacteria bacterium]
SRATGRLGVPVRSGRSVRPDPAPGRPSPVRRGASPGWLTLAFLWGLGTVARGILITVLPLTALRVFHDAQAVSEVYFGTSLTALAFTLGTPWLIGRLGKRRVFILGCLLLALSAGLIALEAPLLVLAGMVLQLWGVLGVEIPLSLYVLDHVARRDLVRFEPIRLVMAAGPWTVGPWLGVTMQENLASWSPFALSAGAAFVLLGCFLALGLADRVAAPTRPRPVSPLRLIPRFVRQPRLRLAWVLAFGRSGWWYMFFIYAPIYCVTSGLGAEVSGAVVSLGSAGIFAAPLWGWVARRVGLRRHMTAAYALGGAATFAVALVAGLPWLAALLLLCACAVVSAIDGAGNTLFLRAVRPLERAEMTAVFMMYRDTSQLVIPGFYAILLLVLPLPFVFVTSGLVTAALALFARYIPRRM